MSLLAHDKLDMRRGWNARAARNPYFYVETSYWNGNIERFFALGEESARLLIDPILARLEPERGLALDLGCGVGRFSRALARRFDRVVAVDVSDQMLAEAKRQQFSHDCKNVTFKKSDGVALPIADDSVDFVWSYEVFQHIPTHRAIEANIAEVGRVLRPAGTAMIHFKTGYQRPRLHAVLRHLPQWAIALAMRITRQDPLMADRAFRGAPPLSREQIETMLGKGGLPVLEIFNDPTHPDGTRAFAIATKHRSV